MQINRLLMVWLAAGSQSHRRRRTSRTAHALHWWILCSINWWNLISSAEKTVVSFILQTMDPGNSTTRKNCLKNSMTALKDVLRVFPMISLNDTSTRLAVGDAIGDINDASIQVYDMQSMSKIKVLDASGPPGRPGLLEGASEMAINSAISALSFSPDGEGLAALSENGLMIRWWSLGFVWWEKLNRNFVPVHQADIYSSMGGIFTQFY